MLGAEQQTSLNKNLLKADRAITHSSKRRSHTEHSRMRKKEYLNGEP